MATTTSAVPAPAAAVGYDTQTFGPAVTLGSNWQTFNFFGVQPRKRRRDPKRGRQCNYHWWRG